MADDGKHGTAWGDDELDLIVSDYFSMLASELRKEKYVKAAHRAALTEQIGRTDKAIEFKHMNISAVLRELGMPWIDGYRPMENYQGTIFDAIDRYLATFPQVLYFELSSSSAVDLDRLSLEPAPLLSCPTTPKPEELVRLVKKFDPTERDFRNRKLGMAGEELVFAFECRRLEWLERADLARQVRWVAQEDGDGAGYDIRSFDQSGAERLIEVKTTCGGARTPFFVTRNEHSLAEERPEAFRLYRVFRYSMGARLFELSPPLNGKIRLEPLTFLASFG